MMKLGVEKTLRPQMSEGIPSLPKYLGISLFNMIDIIYYRRIVEFLST